MLKTTLLSLSLAVAAPSSDDVVDTIRASLEGSSEVINLDHAEVRIISISGARGAAPESEVDVLSFETRTGRFRALLTEDGKRRVVSGRAEVIRSVWTPSRSIASGDRIRESDLAETTVSAARAPRGAVFDKSELVGKEARRTLLEGRPVTQDAIGEPIVIRRNDAVALVFENASVSLRAKGRALEDGARGEVIRVMNVDGVQTLDGRVVASGVVQVR